MSKLTRQLLLLSIDVLATITVMLLAFLIRFSMDGRPVPIEYVYTYARALPIIVPFRIVIYYAFGLYSQMWSHASISELLRIAWVVTIDSAITSAIIFIMPHTGFPRSVLLIGWFMKIGALGSIRLALRLRHEYYRARMAAGKPSQKTVIYGAGDAGALLVREFAKHPELGCNVVGLIDDDPYKQGYRIAGKAVLGSRKSLEQVVKQYGVTHMVIAMPSVKGAVVREIVQIGQRLGLQLKTVPGIYELVNGAVTVSQIRDVQIEDVLGRDEVKVDLEAIAAYLTGETVLITGAGGSIGSELCRQVARFGPKQMILLGHGENSIYEIDMELRRKYPALDIRPVIADIQDEVRIRRVFEQHRPGVVFHAAAHKHVPLMEYNPEEAIKNNVFGTYNVAKAADTFRVKRFVLISSDKAVNPTSVMGATKRAAEIVIQSLARTSSTVFVAVRFGNVLGSRGSVIPLFKKQIAAGGPVTITDARMVRYFMTIPEAVQLVIQASSMGRGGEVFVLDMGKPVRIIDLARDLIRLSGYQPDVDIQIAVTGMRPGEKLFEELLTAEEGTAATMHERIFVAHQDSIPASALGGFLDEMNDLARSGRAGNTSVLALVADVVGKVTLNGAVGAGD
ncbi:MAG TPA: nucleoside-diphosphate sugar epimerase/dehydratase [Symbiobacteriaceae bacterium]|nr:nucleoside-diphosphate sugar epimerase/dehydratase [Symbiobacteriaceae bacterium]